MRKKKTVFACHKLQIDSESLGAIFRRYEYNFLIKLWLVCTLIFSIMCIIVTPTAEYTAKQLIHTLPENYDYVFFTRHSYHTNCLYYVGNSMELHTNNGLKLQGEVLMQSADATYNENSFRRYARTLSSHEIAISRNMAIKNGIAIGDDIAVSYPAWPNEMRVVVVDFFDDTFGIKRNHLGNGVIILGHDPLVAENTNYFASFVSDKITAGSDFVYFMQSQEKIDVNEDITKLWLKIVSLIVMPLIILCALQLFICYFFTVINCSSYYQRQLLLGKRTSLIKREIMIDSFMIYLPFAIIAFLFNTILIRYSLGYIFSYFATCLFVFQWLTTMLSNKVILRKIMYK